MRREAAESYYGERKHEMLATWHHLKFLSGFRRLSWRYRWYHFRFFKEHLTKTFTFTGTFISYLLWGFGERSGRVASFEKAAFRQKCIVVGSNLGVISHFLI